MFRTTLMSLALGAVAAGCVTDDGTAPSPEPDTLATTQATSLSFTREQVIGDVYHYQLVLPAGSGPNAGIRIHRVVRELAPFVARPTSHAVMSLHGDFSTFVTNFTPSMGTPASPVLGLAPYLAQHGIDVWGVDRRWTLAPTDGDVSDFATMTVAQEVDDVRVALGFARAFRLATGSGGGKLALLGFSHGAQLAYAYAAMEAARPAAQRHVNALVPMDYYGGYGPDQAELRALTCEVAAGEYDAVANGDIDVPNLFFIRAAQLARTLPDDPTPFPFLAGLTNRQAFLLIVGQTYFLAPFAPFYHLLAPELDGDLAVGLTETAEDAGLAWFEGAVPHQAMIESADLDAILCGDAPPVAAPLSAIRVPLYYIGAAGGVGVDGLYATTAVSSTDVTVTMVQRYPAERRPEDFGHSDLLFGDDAPGLVFAPLATWLGHH